jgi:23S rRNA (adenine1618-N6)-methyltransferase
MPSPKNTQVKSKLHVRNRNRERYDLDALRKAEPLLEAYLKINKYGDESVDFTNPAAVKMLNKAILNYYYGIKNWDFPDENLCPPIPGRADYIHQIADLLAESNSGEIPLGNKVKGLDIGVGASCIYPILGVTEYGWAFTGSDINTKSIESSRTIIASNAILQDKVECKVQENSASFFRGILSPTDKIDFSMCNPPFHGSAEEAEMGSRRKVQNLSGKKTLKPTLNFSGVNNELIYEGGEFSFLRKMIYESQEFAKNCFWFTTLVSKESNLKGVFKDLEKLEATEVRKIDLETGNKASRIVAWSFLTKEERQIWQESRWKNA